MKILHISDTHGSMPDLRGDFDIVVHSGDFMPNRSFGVRAIEETFQPYWLEEHGTELRAWLGGKPVLICPGNHDFIDPTTHLRAAGVNAHSICDRFLEIEGIGFYGFPWVSVFGDWNFMASSRERRARLAPAIELLDLGEIDVFVTHGPMFGVLDTNGNGNRCGSKVLRQTMQEARFPPRLLLHGHIHEAAGVTRWSRGVIVSNAATTQRVLEVKV